MIEVGIVGGSGYGAIELVRLLQHHPLTNIKYVFSHSKEGQLVGETFPHLSQLQLKFSALNPSTVSCDIIFFATPSNVSKHLIPDLLDKGIKVIDLSGDFRIKDKNTYKAYYHEYPAEDKYLKQAVYGLCEWMDEHQAPTLIANPGCFPTATLLALAPLVKNHLIDTKNIIVDAKTGVSGAGRSTHLYTHFPELNENFKAYGVGKHKHLPEMNQFLSNISNQEINIRFTPHLVPMNRGILSTCYVTFKDKVTEAAIHELYQTHYANKPFVRIRESSNYPSTKEVQGSNYCDIGIYVDEASQTGIIISVIDNLVKGASGQAIQNMNRLFGLEEQTGLTMTPVYP